MSAIDEDAGTEAGTLPFPQLHEHVFGTHEAPLSVLTDDGVFSCTGTRIAFTDRHGGAGAAPYDSLNLSAHIDDDPLVVGENRRRVCAALGAAGDADLLVSPRQVHGEAVVHVEDPLACRKRVADGADGVVCTRAGVPVLLVFADCVPVVLVAPGGAFAVVHSGWRGAIAGIAGKGLSRLAAAAGCAPGACNAYVGPHIGACCYEVGGDLLARFVSRFGPACDAGVGHLDLGEAVRASLLEAGADPGRVADAGRCTSCHPEKYFSHRAENGLTGRHGAFAYRKEHEDGT